MEQLRIVDDNFVLRKEFKKLRLVHLTYEENIQSIKINGFRTGEGLFGKGLYVCDLDNEESIESLINFSRDLIEEECDEIVVIEGIYEGMYERCINTNEYFEYAKGFILIKNTKNIEIEKISVIQQIDLKGYLSRRFLTTLHT